MNRKERIQSILLNNLNTWDIKIIDNSSEHSGHNKFDGTQESHFNIVLINKSKKKFNKLEIHRKTYFLLKEEFNNGLHALQINIL